MSRTLIKVLGLGLMGILAACSGSAGPEGPAGEKGANGASGAAGPTGSGGNDGMTGATGASGAQGVTGATGPIGMTLTLSTRAQRGLRISPVVLSTAGATQAQLESIGMGSYLVNAQGACNDCHAQQTMTGPKFLGGGTDFAIPLSPTSTAHIYARNLTPDPNNGLKLTEAQFIQALRTGLDVRNSTITANPPQMLIVMPWPNYRWMKDSDLKAIYSYLKVIPAVDNTVPVDQKGPLAFAQPLPEPTNYNEGNVVRELPPAGVEDPFDFLRGMAISPVADPPNFDSLPADVQGLFARGSYLVNSISACNDCHTNDAARGGARVQMPGPTFLKINTASFLTGGAVFAVPPPLATLTHEVRTMSRNLVGLQNGFNEGFRNFLFVVTTGKHPDSPLGIGFPMPWQVFRHMQIDDLEAIFTYISTITRNSTADKVTQDPAIYCDANIACPTVGGYTCAMSTNECIGNMCSGAEECGACQVCNAGACEAPLANSPCLSVGI